MNGEIVAALLYGAFIGFMIGQYVESRQRSADNELNQIRRQIDGMRRDLDHLTRRF